MDSANEPTIFSIDKRSSKKEQALEKVFILSVLFKLTFGAVEAICGFILLGVSNHSIERLVEHINAIVVFGYQPNFSAVSFTDQKMFLSMYAILHGIPKVLLALVLIKRKLWGYPLSLVILAGFIAYQIYEIFHGRSLFFMVAVTIFDVFVWYLIVHEWKRDRALFERRAKREALKAKEA